MLNETTTEYILAPRTNTEDPIMSPKIAPRSVPFVSVLLASILSFVAFSSLLDASATSVVDPPIQNIAVVSKKLEAYALGQAEHSEVTREELDAAIQEHLKWSIEAVMHKKEANPIYHLLFDCALNPLVRFTKNHGHIMEVDPDKLFIYQLMIERFYKKFRPAYLGRMIGSEMLKSEKLNKLLNSLAGLKNAEPVVTKRILIDAMTEYDAYVQKFHDLGVQEDIFFSERYLMLLLNVLNRSDVKILKKTIFPLVHKMGNNLDVETLKKVYLTEISKIGVYVEDGVLKTRA